MGPIKFSGKFLPVKLTYISKEKCQIHYFSTCLFEKNLNLSPNYFRSTLPNSKRIENALLPNYFLSTVSNWCEIMSFRVSIPYSTQNS